MIYAVYYYYLLLSSNFTKFALQITLIMLVCVVLFLIHCHLSKGFIPQITDRIETAVVQEKGTAYLNCTAVIEEQQESQISWYRTVDKQQISSGSTLKDPVRRGPHGVSKYAVRFLPGRPNYAPNMAGIDVNKLRTYQLIVRFVDINDADTQFKCVIELRTTPVNQWPVAYGNIIVKRAPEILPGLTSKIVTEGDSLTLVCRAQGSPPPMISWTRANGRPLSLPGSPQRIYNSTLYIPRVDRYDRGVYRCYAVNNVAGSAEYDVMVEVNYAPHVREARFKGAYGQAPDGNYDMTLECIVNGYPDPDLLWYNGIYDPITNNKPLFDNNRYELEKAQSYGAAGTNITDVFSTLLIRNVRVGDYGNYSCRAENKYGSNFVVLSLFYQSICQGAYCPMLGAVSLDARVNEDGTSVIN
ncbi:Lachesin [Schistosoma japonicum]|nr:Lachesin [Schistosoma japonicum]